MAITKERRQELLAQYEIEISNSRAMIITEFSGLNTTELGKLRTNVREAQGSFAVVKLTLLRLALQRAGMPIPEDQLSGPVAIGFCHQEVPAVAKALKDFGEDREQFVVKGGIMGNRVLSVADVEAIADLPPLDVIRAQLMGIISAPARNVASVVASGVRQVINVFNAYATSEEAEDVQEAGVDA